MELIKVDEFVNKLWQTVRIETKKLTKKVDRSKKIWLSSERLHIRIFPLFVVTKWTTKNSSKNCWLKEYYDNIKSDFRIGDILHICRNYKYLAQIVHEFQKIIFIETLTAKLA